MVGRSLRTSEYVKFLSKIELGSDNKVRSQCAVLGADLAHLCDNALCSLYLAAQQFSNHAFERMS